MCCVASNGAAQLSEEQYSTIHAQGSPGWGGDFFLPYADCLDFLPACWMNMSRLFSELSRDLFQCVRPTLSPENVSVAGGSFILFRYEAPLNCGLEIVTCNAVVNVCRHVHGEEKVVIKSGRSRGRE